MLDFKVRIFHSAATYLSFTRAAEENYISQPAVSKAIKQLEHQLGYALFERSGSNLKLTNAGVILNASVSKAIELEKQMQYDFGLLKNEHIGLFTLGASTTIAQYVIPKILLQFCNSNPKLEVKMLSGNTLDIETATIEKKVDLGIVEGLSHRSGLRYIPFMEDNLTIVCHKNNPLFYRSKISLELLKSQPIILRERGSGTLEVIEHTLKNHNLKISDLNVKLFLGSTESIKNALESGSCIAVVSENSIKNEVYNDVIKPLYVDGLTFNRTFSFILPQGIDTGIGEAFIQFALHNS